MRKLFLALFTVTAIQAQSQTLFTIGNDSVSVSDFLAAYRKNNAAPHNDKALRNYLELFIASKLKIKEARARGLDTGAQFRSDLEGLRAQVLPAYTNDPESVNRLTDEAFQRSQKDLEVAHIFISAPNGDTATAFKKATEALASLKSGTSFEAAAARYSDDPTAKTNGGSLGFITVFTLPYTLENLVYSTPVGKLAPLYRSKAGYHILKVTAERPAVGRMRAAQILLAFAPGAADAEKLALQKKADSLYRALMRGADFAHLAETYSNDPITAGAGGLLPEFGIGQYDPTFEQQVFSLSKDGAITTPFATAHGIHIVKRISRIPAFKTKTAAVIEQLRTAVQQSDRMQTTRREQAQHVLTLAGYEPVSATMLAALRTRTRQELEGAVAAESLNSNTPLFRLGSQEYTVNQWLNWVRNNLVAEDGNTERSFDELWDLFVQTAAMEHYQKNLEQYNNAFRQQMIELEEGNLFFEIMQREIWTPAQADSLALQAFYNQHKSAYRWQRSADAVLFYTGSKATADKLAAQIRKAPQRWRQWAAQYNTDVTADSARLEWRAIPGYDQTPFEKGQITAPQVNTTDGTAVFAFIVKTYDQPVQRSFEEARGAVINDFQAQKEKEWIEALKKKYPVKLNEAALSSLSSAKAGGI